jgi:hypothetical protein
MFSRTPQTHREVKDQPAARGELSCHRSPRQPAENSARGQCSVGDASERELTGKYKTCHSAGQGDQNADEDGVCSPSRTIIRSAALLVVGSFPNNTKIVPRKHTLVVTGILSMVAIIHPAVSPMSSLHRRITFLSVARKSLMFLV